MIGNLKMLFYYKIIFLLDINIKHILFLFFVCDFFCLKMSNVLSFVHNDRPLILPTFSHG